MLKKLVILLSLVISMQGCACLGLSLEAKTTDKARVDQLLDGNLGYVKGDPILPDEQRKLTRKTFDFSLEESERINVIEQINRLDKWIEKNFW